MNNAPMTHPAPPTPAYDLNVPIGVVGFGRTGRAVLDFLLDHKGTPPPYLFNDTPITDTAAREMYEKRGVIFLIGADRFPMLEEAELIILSPGVNGRTPRFDELRRFGIPVISELELAASLIDIPLVAVTGTNGKSTVVSLIHHLLTATGINSYLTGNIGTPLISRVKDIIDHAKEPGGEAVAVVEVSSFQLEEIRYFRPHIGVILNVTPDHLDRYADEAAYFAAKANLAVNQRDSDHLILNADSPRLQSAGDAGFPGRAQRTWFSLKSLKQITGTDTACLRLEIGGKTEELSLAGNPLRGTHNLENILAAVIAARLAGAPATGIAAALAGFKGLPHRMENVGTLDNVEFINDSKATNVDAALKSIDGIDAPLVVILGGKDKGGDFTRLEAALRDRALDIILLGQAAPVIRAQLTGLHDRFRVATDMEEAVQMGYQRLKKEKGGVLLLAPGCASFDMYNSFEHRGEVFRQAVAALQAQKGGHTDG